MDFNGIKDSITPSWILHPPKFWLIFLSTLWMFRKIKLCWQRKSSKSAHRGQYTCKIAIACKLQKQFLLFNITPYFHVKVYMQAESVKQSKKKWEMLKYTAYSHWANDIEYFWINCWLGATYNSNYKLFSFI